MIFVQHSIRLTVKSMAFHLRGLPFVSEALRKIYKSLRRIGDRVGNVRFAVTYKPTSDPMDRAYAKERAQQITEWSRAATQRRYQ